MKIGIISINMYSKGLNFACPLHNYAFQQFLLENGIENTIVSYKPVYFNDFDLRHPYDYYVKMCADFAASGRSITEPEEWKRMTGLREAWKALYKERERRYDKFQNFIESNYIKTDECYDSDLLEIKDPGFDCYICCTDVIWKQEPNIGFDRGFFLASKAMENKWKISYAASRGVYHSETEEDEKTFLHYVGDIDAVSVRENSLKEYLEENIDNEVTMVLDPVLLHKKEFYDKILVKPEEEHYLFLYYVMEKANDTIEQAVRYAKAHNLKIIEITDRPLKDGRLSEYEDIDRVYNYDMGIEEWLGYIKYADCVFTNSFHACCFSILFEKQFYAGYRHGDKVTYVLDMFGLTGRRLSKDRDIIAAPLPDIDYSQVRPLMEKRRQESSEFILSAIRRMENSERPEHDYEWWKRRIQYKVYCNSGVYPEVGRGTYESSKGEVKELLTGSKEYWPKKRVMNDGLSRFKRNEFSRKGYLPDGWRFRFRIDRRWFWYLEDGTFVLKDEYDKDKHPAIKKFAECDHIPYLPVTGISLMVAEALWKEGCAEYTVIYNGGLKSGQLSHSYDGSKGRLHLLNTGSVEYRIEEPAVNDGTTRLLKNKFSHPGYEFLGWQMRIKDNDRWYWYLADRTLKLQSEYCKEKDGEKYLIRDGAKIPYIPANHVTTAVLEGVWEAKLKTRVTRKINKLRGQK
ncbi:MAG: polysaccharide pyruvyl transferase family protein [Dorea sp.]|nr:polysaccharide pyruvyl transferase family protein [Dorea sp.]